MSSTGRSDMYLLAGSISTFMSGTVVVTGLFNRKQMLDPTRVFSHLIWLISLTDFLGAVSLTMGIPRNGTPQCTFQAFMYTFFFPASWMWTLFLVFQLRCVLIHNQVWVKAPAMHAIVWTVSALCSFLPYSTNNYYGQDDAENGFLPCNYGGNDNAGYWWGVFTFSIIIYLVSFIMLYYMVEVKRFWAQNSTVVSAKQLAVYQASRLYPLTMCVCWVPYVSVALVPPLSVVNSPNEWYYELCLFASSQYGTLIALIFFTHTPTITKKILVALRWTTMNDATDHRASGTTASTLHIRPSSARLNNASTDTSSTSISALAMADDDDMPNESFDGTIASFVVAEKDTGRRASEMVDLGLSSI